MGWVLFRVPFPFPIKICMNEIQKFMELGVDDQIMTAGEVVVITRPTQRSISYTVNAVVTSRDGSYSAQVGGGDYQVTGHALVRKRDLTSGQEIKVGDNLQQDSGEKWMIVNAISSSNDAGISCDLIRKS